MRLYLLAVLLVATAMLAPANDKPKPPSKSSDTPVVAADPKPVEQPAVAGAPAGYRIILAAARAKAATQLAKKEGISRSAAREKIDEIDDRTLLEAAAAAGVVIKAQPVGGKLSDFLDWLLAHSDQILALVKILLAFFS